MAACFAAQILWNRLNFVEKFEKQRKLNFILTISKKQVNQSLKMCVHTLYMYIDNIHIVSLVLYTSFKKNNKELESITD